MRDEMNKSHVKNVTILNIYNYIYIIILIFIKSYAIPSHMYFFQMYVYLFIHLFNTHLKPVIFYIKSLLLWLFYSKLRLVTVIFYSKLTVQCIFNTVFLYSTCTTCYGNVPRKGLTTVIFGWIHSILLWNSFTVAYCSQTEFHRNSLEWRLSKV